MKAQTKLQIMVFGTFTVLCGYMVWAFLDWRCRRTILWEMEVTGQSGSTPVCLSIREFSERGGVKNRYSLGFYEHGCTVPLAGDEFWVDTDSEKVAKVFVHKAPPDGYLCELWPQYGINDVHPRVIEVKGSYGNGKQTWKRDPMWGVKGSREK